jgi:hypothetical protein
MAKHGSNAKLKFIGDAYLTAFGLCTPGDENFDRTPPDPREVEICKRWLRRNAAPRKTMNPRSHSYCLKHVVERAAGNYVTNGALISAAIEIGYRCKRIRGGPNAIFNMTLTEAIEDGKTS